MSLAHQSCRRLPRLLTRSHSAGVGPFDQRSIAERDDVLSYTTAALSQMVISGAVNASISFILDQPDADIVLQLCDVYPDGRLELMLEGHARVWRQRRAITLTLLLVPPANCILSTWIWAIYRLPSTRVIGWHYC